MFSTYSDPYLRFALWTGVGTLTLTLLLAAQIVYLRISLRRQRTREQACTAKWRPILNAALAQMAPDDLPRLGRQERIMFLQLWLHLHESVRGEAHEALNGIAYRLHCDAIADRLLRRRDRGYQLLGILSLGHLRARSAWPLLLDHAGRSDSVTSIHALWALVQIDPHAAAAEMMETVIRREDWPLSQVSRTLQDVRDIWAPLLAETIARLEDRDLPRALRLAHALRIDLPLPLLTRLLRHPSAEVLVGTLRAATAPGLLPDIRGYLIHPDWRVRMRAAEALGRIGNRSDIDRLRRLLDDSQWWVRYRAAQALLDLPFLDKQEIDQLVLNTPDRFAADMLKQVLAERKAQ